MKPLQLAYIPVDQDQRALNDVRLMFEKDPADILRLANLPIGTPWQTVAPLMLKTIQEARAQSKVFKNDQYQVAVFHHHEPAPGMVHLSIKRIDKKPIHDWRDLQEIKNQILGEEAEAVELYPAQSRLVDSANQYHLWAWANGMRFPFGFEDRFVADHLEGTSAQQRKL